MPWLLFLAFEVLTYALLSWLLRDLGEPDQWQPRNTITANWAKAVWFILGHLLLTIGAYLILAQRLPQKHRRQVMPWFWRSLLAMVLETLVLMA